MLAFLTRVLCPPRVPPPPSLHDPFFGEVRPDEEGEGWQVRVPVAGAAHVEFNFGGTREPDAARLAHAREIVAGYPAFHRRVAEFLAAEVTAFPYPEGAAEIRALTLESVCLW